MRLIKIFAVLLFASSMFISCGGGSADSPKAAVEQFLKATMVDYDFDKAKNYIVKEMHADMDESKKQMGGVTKEQLKMAKELLGEIKFEVTDEKISEDGNSATVTVKMSMMGQENTETIPVVKEDGAWKVKEMMGMM